MSTPPIAPVPSFPRFTSLPYEIRQMIWRSAFVPRIVFLERRDFESHKCSRVWAQTANDDENSAAFFDLDHLSGYEWFPQGPEPGFRFISRCPIPLMFVCKEACDEVKKSYTKSFGTVAAPPNILFNFDIDTLYLDSAWRVGLEGSRMYELSDISDDILEVKHLAVQEARKELAAIVQGPRNLESVVLVVQGHGLDETTQLVLWGQEELRIPQRHRVMDQSSYHPVLLKHFPDLEDTWETHYLLNHRFIEELLEFDVDIWYQAEDENCAAAANAGSTVDSTDHNPLSCVMPSLRYKMIIPLQLKLDLEDEMRKFDAEKDATR